MKTLFQLTLLLLALLLPTTATAHDFEVDGIYYNINGNNATVTYKGTYYNSFSNEYSGDVTIPTTVTYNGTTYSVTSIGGQVFSGCSDLTSITIPNSVTLIGWRAFSGCSGLTSISIPNSVTSIGDWAFSGCSGLTSIIIGNSVTSIGNGAFGGCSGLTSITIPNSVTSIGGEAFSGCCSLTNITIPNSLTSIGASAFSGCGNLTSISIPNSVTSIGNEAFYDTPWFNNQPDGLVYAGLVAYKFKGTMPDGTNIILKEDTRGISANAFIDCGGLTSISIPNSVTEIGDGAFWNCSSLTSVTIPNSVTSIGGSTFSGCSGLTSVIIGNSVTEIGGEAFSGCSSLTSIIIPNSVTFIGVCAFAGCSSMNSITIPNSVTSISFEAFIGCSSLTRVNIEDIAAWCNIYFWSSNPLSGAHLYMNDEEITDLIIPNSVTYIGREAFYGCIGLTSITMPNSVNYIEEFAFYDCSGLTNVTIGNSVTSIGEHAFSGCSGLTSITIPNSVTYIDDDAFAYCSGLTSIIIPNTVSSIGTDVRAFYGCNNLTTVFLTGEGDWTAGTLPEVATLYIDKGITGVKGIYEKPTDVFSFATTPPTCDENSFLDYSGTLHVPAASLAAYFTAPYWCNFANIVGDAVKPNGLSLDKDSLELILPETAMLATRISPATATSNIINWASSNPSVATVVNGQVTAVGLGECEIVALCADQKAVCHVIVYNDRISVDPQEVQVLPNHMMTLTPTSLAATLPALTVTSSDPTVAAARVMNGKVQIVGVSEGTATITVASADGTAKPATCLVTVYTEQGDANGDGFIDIDDVTSLIERVLGNDVPNFKEKNGDMNDDGVLDIDDVTALINTILGTT